MVRRFSLIAALMVVAGTLVPMKAAAGGGCHANMNAGVSTSTEATARIEDCAFQPSVTYIEPGDKVTWRNNDIFGHTVTGANGSWGDDTNLNKGDTVSFTFEEEGVFPYYCAYHPSMVGAVVVGDGRGDDSLSADAGVVPADDPPTASTSSAPETSGLSQATIIAFALGALGVAVSLMTWRSWRLRRRHAPAAPSL
jgi:plastocyanin